MARSTPLLAALVTGAICLSAVNFLAFVAAPSQPRLRNGVARRARAVRGQVGVNDLMNQMPPGLAGGAAAAPAAPQKGPASVSDLMNQLPPGLAGGAAPPAAPAAPQAAAAPAVPQVKGEYDITDADIEKFYQETVSGSGGPPPKGSVVGELIVKAFYGELKPTGFERYSGMWKGPPPGAIGKKDTKVAMEKLSAFMKEAPQAMITKGGAEFGKDETQRVVDDGKGWVWLAADMSPGGLAMQMYTSIPYGKRPVMVARKGQVDEMLSKINWDIMDKRVDTTMGGPHVKQR